MAKVTLITHTPEPERTIAAAAKLCYSAATIDDVMEKLTPEKTADFVEMLAGLGHQSPIEHAVFTFGIEGVSRTLLAQITRHRIASYSVQSQRYVRENDFQYVIPPEIEAVPEAKEEFLRAMEESVAHYQKITEILKTRHTGELMATGLSEKEAARKAEKMAIEDARFVLPNACDTKMIVTMNARSLMNFFHLRCCNRAQWEIRDVADQMLRLCLSVAPTLFCKAGPPCACGECPEGKMTCGKAAEMRQRYAAMKEEAKNGYDQ